MPHKPSRLTASRPTKPARTSRRQSSLPPHIAKLYGTAAWTKRSLAHRFAEPLCRACKAKGIITQAAVADHIERATDEQSFWHGELQSLCAEHHNSKRHAESRPEGQARPDWLPRPACQVTLVCGPPGSGKSTYVKDHADRGDIVIDLDEIRSEVSGLPIYQSGKDWLGPALAERNSRLAALSRQRHAARAWVIVSAPSAGQRNWWQIQLLADVVLCDVPPAECKRRIRADSRRAKVVDHHLHAVDEWWAIERGLQMPKALKRGADVNGIPTDPAHPWNADGLPLDS